MSAEVRLPRLLRKELAGSALRERGRLRPAALSADRSLVPLSTADMTLAEDDLEVRVHDLAEIYGPEGSLGIFRAASVTREYGRQTRVRLNHAIDVLNDAVIPGEEDITGTVAQVLAQVLAAQTAKLGNIVYWQLGTVADTSSYTLKNNYGNALAALRKIAEDEDGYYFDFDFSTFPWTLNFLARSGEVMSEFRLPRNMESCQVTLDDSQQCTRLYLSVDTTATDAQLGDQVTTTHEVYSSAAAQAEWGVIARTAGVDAADVPDRAAWAAAYFSRHGDPTVQITIDGHDLYRLTGESLDRVRLGGLCRVALPDYGHTFSLRAVRLRYPDLLRQPERVTVELNNHRQDAAGAFSSLRRQADRNTYSSRRNSTSIINDRYSLRVQDKHITDIGTVLHSAGLEIDAHGVWLFASEDAEDYALGAKFTVQAGQITSLVQKTGVDSLGNNETLYSKVSQTATDITSLVNKTGVNSLGQNETLYSKVSQTATDITSLVNKTGVNSLGQNETLYSKISQNAASISLEVSRATGAESGLGSRIDITESNISLKADTVDVTAVRTSINNLKTGVTTATFLKATSLSATNFYFNGGTVRTRNVTIGNENLDVLVRYSDD